MKEVMEDTNTKESIEAPAPKTMEVGIQYRPTGKIYTFLADSSELASGDAVIVESESGEALGYVIVPPHVAKEGEALQGTKKVLRRASPQEIEREAARKEKALSFFATCQEKIRESGLQMKLIDVQLEDNEKKVVFIFFAEQRIDFRGLVKDLAQTLHMRIEMRQIGARDGAKYEGCLGPCGIQTCCSLYLRDFQSISISMAKHQGLTPNPAKLTGMCGKLKCCLAYEHGVYNECRKELPKQGLAVMSPSGPGKVIGYNILARECVIGLYAGGDHRFKCSELRPLTSEERDAAIAVARKAEEATEGRRRERLERRGR